MARSSTTRRTLFMHPAHRTIGVSGDRTAMGPYFPIKTLSVDDSSAPPLRVALAASRKNADISLAQALFEQAINHHGKADCRRVELNAAGVEFDSLSDSDCLVVFERGLHMARHLSDLDLAGCLAGESASEGAAATTVEVTLENQWHPVLMGVEPFASRSDVASRVRIPPDATVLLSVRTAEEMRPVAWVRHRRHGRVFHTMLGSPRDFRQPAFVRLILNAFTWIGQ